MRTLVKTAKMASAAAIAGLAIGLSATTQAEPSVLQVKETTKSDYAKTKFPILMVHGWLGWSRIGTESVGLDYWYQILPDMARNGLCCSIITGKHYGLSW